MSQDRFITIYKEGSKIGPEGLKKVIMDRATGVCYLNTKTAYSEGLTPLIGPNGLPLVVPPNQRPQ